MIVRNKLLQKNEVQYISRWQIPILLVRYIGLLNKKETSFSTLSQFVVIETEIF
jgi:hypothetical protein